jgi:streptogramin lyase
VFEPFPKPRPTTYEVTSDSQNNGWFTVIARENLGRIDAKTGEITIYKTPTPRSGPRRGSIDSQDRFWFAENRANKIGVFDPKTEKFQEWEAPTPEYNPYDVVVDKNDEAWAGTEFADSVMRVNTKSGETTEYLLPRHTNMRRTFVDNSTTPVTFWVGNTHGASIVKVEPLD